MEQVEKMMNFDLSATSKSWCSVKVHSCNVCKTKGRWCKHLVPVCTNCKGAHTADNKQCEAYRATIRNPNKGMDLDNPIDIECETKPTSASSKSI
jgi:hypothetical protein